MWTKRCEIEGVKRNFIVRLFLVKSRVSSLDLLGMDFKYEEYLYVLSHCEKRVRWEISDNKNPLTLNKKWRVVCEILKQYTLTVLSRCTIALIVHWLWNKNNGKKIGDCSHTIKNPSHSGTVRKWGVNLL